MVRDGIVELVRNRKLRWTSQPAVSGRAVTHRSREPEYNDETTEAFDNQLVACRSYAKAGDYASTPVRKLIASRYLLFLVRSCTTHRLYRLDLCPRCFGSAETRRPSISSTCTASSKMATIINSPDSRQLEINGSASADDCPRVCIWISGLCAGDPELMGNPDRQRCSLASPGRNNQVVKRLVGQCEINWPCRICTAQSK